MGVLGRFRAPASALLFCIGAAFSSLIFVGCGSDLGSSTTSPTQSTTANVAGSWTFTFTASPVCTQVPAALQRRVYAAVITQSAAAVSVNFNNVQSFSTLIFGGTVAGSTINFGIVSFSENTSSTQAFAVVGTLTATVSGSTITGTLNGTETVFNFSSGANVTCNAVNHQITFTR